MQGGPPIPWFVAEAIHKHLYRHSQPLELMAQRGGFGWGEVEWMWSDRPPRSEPGPRSHTTSEQRAACNAQIHAALEQLR